jgi:predicted phosphodiesterase
LALFSDIHFGSGATDYKRVKQDAEIVVNTPRFFGEFHGDGCDNWLITKLARLQRGQVLTHDKEWQLFQAWLDLLGDRLKIVVSGNHDNWSISMGGTDRVRDLIRGLDLLYDPDEVEFDLVVGEESYRFLIRHKWKWSSIFNPTHGIEVSWQRNKPFDVGIGGHTHIATLHRPFIRHGKRRHAIITGTYKLWDRFGLEIGLPAPASYGSGALVFDKFGRMQWFDELELAANYLTYLLS